MNLIKSDLIVVERCVTAYDEDLINRYIYKYIINNYPSDL